MNQRYRLALSWALGCAFTLSSSAVLFSPAAAQVFTERPATAPKPSTRAKPRPTPTATPKAPRQPALAPREARPRTFADPAAYCQANPDIDAPGHPYAGPPVPDWLPGALAGFGSKQSGNGERAYSWRCMSGKVLACVSPAGEDRCSKPSQEREPTTEMTQYCADKRKGEIPMAISGNSLAIWTCRNKQPAIAGYRSGLDKQGYLGSSWMDMTDYSPANMIGAVPRSLAGTWSGRVGGTSLLGIIGFTTVFRITGGQAGASVGTLEYYQSTSSGQLQLGCTVDLVLLSATPTAMVARERISRHGTVSRCGPEDQVTLQPRDGQLFVEWRNLKNNKVRVSGWVQRVSGR